MNSDDNRDQILKELTQVQLKDAKELLLSSFSEYSERLILLLKQALKSVKDDAAEKGLKNFADSILDQWLHKDAEEEEEDTKGSPAWLIKIQETIAVLDAEVKLKQQEDRFLSKTEDSFFLKNAKFVKRTLRSSQKLGNNTGNSFRKLFGKEPKEFQPWQQQVPLQNIVYLNLLRSFSWINDWRNEFHKLEAEALLETDAWIFSSTGLLKGKPEGREQKEKQEQDELFIPNKDDLIVFFKEAINMIEGAQRSYKVKLEEVFSEIIDDIEQALLITDTIGYSKSEYAEEKINRKENNVLQAHQSKEDHWGGLITVLADRVNLSVRFRQLQEQSKERVSGFSGSIEEVFRVNIETPQEELLSLLDEAIAIFDDSSDRSPKQVQELSAAHKEKMGEHLENKLLRSVRELAEEAVLSTKLDRFTSAIPEWTKEQPEKVVLVEKLDLTEFPPKYEFEDVDWQVLVQRVINNQMAKELLPKEVKAEQFLAEVLEDLNEITQIIYTNLEMVNEVKKSDEEEPFEVAYQGLLRARSKLVEDLDLVKEKRGELKGKIIDKHEVAFSKLAVLLERQDVTDVRLAGAEYKARETATDWKTKFSVIWAKVEEKVELFARFIWKKIKEYASLVRKFLGFGEKEKLEEDKTDLATFLSETDEQISRLPFIYRRLFDFNKEVDERFYIRRPEQFERFRKGYELWKNNFPSTFGIFGEKGSGKSIFISLLKEEIVTDHDVIEISFEKTIWKPEELVELISSGLKLDDISTTEELIEAIGRKKKRVVVVLDNIQNCYVRNISGFEAIEHLLYLISETNKNILWVVSSIRYGWQFLDKVLNIADYFTHLAQTDNLSNDQIKELILGRHTSSGYQLTFIPDEAAKNSRSYRKIMDDEEKKQEFLKDRYFEKLSKLSEGNSSIAMIYWIRSIKEYDETHFFINPFDFGTINRIDELESAELFALAAFVLHDSLTPEHLSKILHQPLRDCRLMTSRLASKAILTKVDREYILNHLIYRQVVRVLKEANFIH
jgi:hypothetical protein